MDGSCDDDGNDCNTTDPWTRGPDSLPLEYCNPIQLVDWYIYGYLDNGDQDCDGLTDLKEDRCCMQDNDNDGFCDVQFVSDSFNPDSNYGPAEDGEDCNGNDPNINPGAIEICDDGIDNNCNNQIDEPECCYDTDNDEDGYTDCDGDCDDNNANINPGAIEICDGIDNNCDGSIDNILGTCGIGAC
eukprot:463117_1